jgi:NADPH:quinone reductase
MKMQAMVMTGHGGPEVLEFKEVEAPTIRGPHDVLVRVRAAGVNPADWQLRRRPFAGYVKEQNPDGLILGLDGAGVVEAVGSAVTRFTPGDEVYYVDGGYGPQGSYAQYKVVDEHYLAAKPRSLDFHQAGAAPCALITSWEALYERAVIRPGDFVLIHGGAGGLGHLGIQLAVHKGARVAATVSSEQKAAIAREFGAEKVIFYRDEDVLAAVRDWTGKDGADLVYDTVGKANFAKSVDLVAPYGTLVNNVVSDWPSGDNRMAEFKNIRIAFENMGLPQVASNHAARIRQTEAFEAAAKLFDEGRLRILMDRVYPLTEAGEAQRAVEAGEIVGRVVLDIP